MKSLDVVEDRSYFTRIPQGNRKRDLKWKLSSDNSDFINQELGKFLIRYKFHLRENCAVPGTLNSSIMQDL